VRSEGLDFLAEWREVASLDFLLLVLFMSSFFFCDVGFSLFFFIRFGWCLLLFFFFSTDIGLILCGFSFCGEVVIFFLISDCY